MKSSTIFKIYLMFAFIIAALSTCNAQCPVKGDSHRANLQHLDSLKNRTAQSIDAALYRVEDFLQDKVSGVDYVTMTGYVVGCKWGGKETCECHSADQADYDIHIEIAATPDETDKDKMMIVEMTRYTRKGTVLADIKKLIGKRVEVEGWTFEDIEHKQNSYDQNPSGTDDWRGTDVEIHPVMRITEIK